MSSADLFSIGSSGLRSMRAQMGAIADNIANANTQNYNRRTVLLQESSVAASSEPLYVPRASFGGSEIVSVDRANDIYLDAAARQTGTALGYANSRVRWLSDMETALGDDALGVGGTLNTMYGAIDKLAASPTDTALRTNMIYTMDQVVNAFHRSSDGLTTVMQGTFTTAQNDTTIVNDSLTALTRINEDLLRSQPGTANYAQLMDNRDAELTKITQRLNVGISFGPNDDAILTYNGSTILQGNTASSFDTLQNANGTLTFRLNGVATATPADGLLGGAFASATLARQRLDSLDTLAVQFSTDMNAWHAQGLTDANAAGGALFSVGTTAASLATSIGNITQIAAKTSDGRPNGNLLNIGTTRGNSSVEKGWTALIASQASTLSTAQAEQEAAELRDETARSARERVSGVDLDREAADLLRTQQAYQAAAKIIQAAKEIADTILRLS
ncbi:flagellar hook-associated protein FlgK [Sphingobium sp. DEHP117]|uniref:flagellar hook-associated protein FlgK n=1 Tax=Sphingobium sp. DEHP117 TaxID=2993436 RepID=UPI0027D629E5|nr:flagellar hook-associated protein FlgK [Sphingobium sp. DEHP117]MDQ4419427.1 flagellar hook-associated protein FlgK [Sphingobium sp. DEHP117]